MTPIINIFEICNTMDSEFWHSGGGRLKLYQTRNTSTNFKQFQASVNTWTNSFRAKIPDETD